MKTLIITLTLLFAYTCISCNNQKKVVEEVSNESIKTLKIAETDSLLIAYERGVCFGKCPEDKIVIYKSGYATYNGIRNVSIEGISSKQISDELFLELKSKLKEIDINKIEAEYGMDISDLPSKTITFTTKNMRKTSVFKSNNKEEIKDLLIVLNAIIDINFKK